MMFGLSSKIAAALAVLLCLTAWGLKHQYDAAHAARLAQRQAEAAAKQLKEDHDAQLAALRRDSDDVRERERAAADIRAAIAAADAPEPPAPVAVAAVPPRAPQAANACARSRPVRALLDGLRHAAAGGASPADPPAAAPVRAGPRHSAGRAAAHGPRDRRTHARRLAGGGGLPRQAGARG